MHLSTRIACSSTVVSLMGSSRCKRLLGNSESLWSSISLSMVTIKKPSWSLRLMQESSVSFGNSTWILRGSQLPSVILPSIISFKLLTVPEAGMPNEVPKLRSWPAVTCVKLRGTYELQVCGSCFSPPVISCVLSAMLATALPSRVASRSLVHSIIQLNDTMQ